VRVCPVCAVVVVVVHAGHGKANLLRCIGTVRLDLRDDGPDIQGYLSQLTNQRTVPSVFISELLPYVVSESGFL
jgi:hypothetical protein